MKRIYPLRKDINELWINDTPNGIQSPLDILMQFLWFGGDEQQFLPVNIGTLLLVQYIGTLNYSGFNLDVVSRPLRKSNINPL